VINRCHLQIVGLDASGNVKTRLEPKIPEETIQVAKAAFPNGNLYLTLKDDLDSTFKDELFRVLVARQR
jgi:hypothetical protein